MPYVYVFIGGGLGSIVRFGVARLLSNYASAFPLATLFANAIACIILGMFTAYSGKNGLPESMSYLFMIGFCGGFSTFSTFSMETFRLLEQGNFFYASLNIIVSLCLCLFCIYLGMRLMR